MFWQVWLHLGRFRVGPLEHAISQQSREQPILFRLNFMSRETSGNLPGRRPSRVPKNKNRKNRKSGSKNEWNGRSNYQGSSMAGACQKCGQPARDGKLCDFHRNLLNSIRNEFR